MTASHGAGLGVVGALIQANTIVSSLGKGHVLPIRPVDQSYPLHDGESLRSVLEIMSAVVRSCPSGDV